MASRAFSRDVRVGAEFTTPGMMIEVEADAVTHDPDGNVLY